MGIKIALAGNPNCGKTTLFNALTGSNQYVGNWPGVTVEKKEGKLKKRSDVIITDLPGIYSLSPYTLEEVVARNYLIEERPDAILNIVDGTNIERNLYLTTQLIELGIPVVVAINMMDIVRKNGDKLDTEALSKELSCPVVEISALKETGIEEAAEIAISEAEKGKPVPMYNFSGLVEHAIAHIEEATVHDLPEEKQRWYAIKVFERDKKVLKMLGLSDQVISHIEKDIKAVETKLDDDAESIITNERYLYVEKILKDCYKKKNSGKLSVSEKIDKVVTNRILALPIFVLVMWLVYYISIGSIGDWTVGFVTEGLFGEGFYLFGSDRFIYGVPVVVEAFLTNIGCADWFVSLVTDGIIGGVGSVLGFVPQMLILFLLLSLLEDCGYMSRVAFIMDKLFRKFGLSGKSFIPMLVATGCGVPGVMASRTIEQDRDRKMTIMTTCFIPCGAKMPIVGFIAGALFGGAAWVATLAYFIGVAAVVISGILLKKTKPFIGKPAPFVMELPSYHAPVAGNILRTTGERGWSFIKKAGTVILAASVIIWILQSLSFENGFHYITEVNPGASILQLIATPISYLFIPLGFGNWQSTVATVLGLVAKEEVVGAFGVFGDEAVSQIFGMGAKGMLSGMSFLIFNLLCAPCFAAMGAIRREMNNWKWTAFAITYMCVFAYAMSLMIYQFGLWFVGGGNIVGTSFAAIVLAIIAFLVFRPAPKTK
ncbi:MAG: ferrous iron transport protein B [Ruminococcaceae bacterium]|nr:ferrous iron transport protein B [Oscillospiraceae bacterium]